MTVIAASVKHSMMAADTQITAESYALNLAQSKILCFPNALIGFCGESKAISDFTRKLKKYFDKKERFINADDFERFVSKYWPENEDAMQGLALTRAALFLLNEGEVIALRDCEMAIGTGAGVARGAMWAGKAPNDAVYCACELDVYCGGDIDIESL